MAQGPGLSGSAHERAEAIVKLCGGGHKAKDGWMVCCPAHDDSKPSLSIGVKGEKVVLKCFSTCTNAAIVEALGLSFADLNAQKTPGTAKARRIVKVYDYYDASGMLVHQTVRFAPKSFSQRRPDPQHPGKFLWDLKTIEPVLYHLPAVIRAVSEGKPIYLVEGEKDADLLAAEGFVATCNPMGAGKWQARYSDVLRNAHVVILADHDTPGQQHAKLVAQSLTGIAASIKVLDVFHTGTPGSDIADWLAEGGTRAEFDAIVGEAPLYEQSSSGAPHLGWSVSGVNGATLTANTSPPSWLKGLFVKKNNDLTQNVYNIMRVLENHERWHDPDAALWWDSVRGTPMCGPQEITDHMMIDIAAWFGEAMRLPITSPRLLEQCVIAHCKKNPRDLLQMWLNDLPPWDGTPRLKTWLSDITGIVQSDYVADTSRVLPVSMVARAIDPGCHYRFVVILEGPEAIGKSSLVRALASPEWFVELSIGLETKEAHMMLQGAWVAELADLDSMTKTEETRMKAFITMRQDSYIPKYSNFRQRTERRTIFVGTTNDETYLKGLSGNTRYLPLRLDTPIDLEQFLQMRTMLFAEALDYYYRHQEAWWLFCDEALETAQEQREQRRVMQVYEHPLHEWLEYKRFAEDYFEDGKRVTFIQDETSWPEIARHFLKLDSPEKWKDRSLQMQIAASLKGLQWEVKQAWKSGRNTNVWRKPTVVPF